MNYIAVKYWVLGYMSALEKNENISREHIEGLTEKFKEMIEELENELLEEIVEENPFEDDDDSLPF